MDTRSDRSGPLAGTTVLEIQGLGPGPFCGMMLSDLGADVIRVDRPEAVLGSADASTDVLSRGRRSVGIDLKSPEGVALLLGMAEQADVLIEGFRPGVMERLGLGPDVCLTRNSRLVYGRVTGYGQDGPWSAAAGHDINYIALSGALWSIGRAGEAPVPPLALVGDFGGGGMLLTIGICAALAERGGSGKGQVVDAAMVDGSAMLNAFLYGMKAAGLWSEERGANLLDSGAPFYDTYETSDGKWISIGAIEPKFYRNLIEKLELNVELRDQNDQREWPQMRERFAKAFAQRSRDDWCELLDGAEACFSPVLSPWEAPEHAHHQARGTFTERFGIVQPRPAPRFGRTPSRIAGPPPRVGQHTDEILAGFGVNHADIERLRESGAIA